MLEVHHHQILCGIEQLPINMEMLQHIATLLDTMISSGDKIAGAQSNDTSGFRRGSVLLQLGVDCK